MSTAFSVPADSDRGDSGDAGRRLVIIAERAAGTSRADPQPAIEAIEAAVSRRHGLTVSDVRFLPAGAIPRTTSGKLARQACRARIPQRHIRHAVSADGGGILAMWVCYSGWQSCCC